MTGQAVDVVRAIRRSPMASIVTDPTSHDNPIIAANRAFEEHTGYAEQDLLGRNCRMLAGPETSRAKSALLSGAVSSATPVVVELLNYRKDGTKFINAVMIAPIFGEDGQLACFLGTQMEIGPRSGRQARLEAAERIDSLTPKQRAVLALMAQGRRNRQIGAELGLAEKTIKMHRSALVRRLGVATAAEAIRLAIEAGH